MDAQASPRSERENGLFSIGCLSTSVFVVYLAYIAYNMHGIMNPLRHVTIAPNEPVIKPLWAEGTKMTASCYLAASKNFYASYRDRAHPQAARAPLVASAEGLTFDQAMTRHLFELNVSALLAGTDENSSVITMLDGKDWNLLMSNRTLYFHVLIEAEPPLGTEGEEQMWTLVGSVPLVKYGPKPNIRPQKNLLTGTSTRSHGEDSEDAAANTAAGGHKAKYISFWKPEVAVRLVADFTEYPHNFVPQTVQGATDIIGLDRNDRWIPDGRGWARLVYKPIVHVDEIGLTSDKYVPLNESLSSLPLRVTIEPMSMQRWQLMQVMEGSLQHQKDNLGFQDSDIDDLRRLISDTNVYLLAVTLLASTLHLLFEFLAFKSDVEFWRRNKSLRGLSVRTLMMEVVFQTIILLSLIEEDASLLVTMPAGIGLLIQIWKVRRATGMQLGRRGIVFTRLEKADERKVARRAERDSATPSPSGSLRSGTRQDTKVNGKSKGVGSKGELSASKRQESRAASKASGDGANNQAMETMRHDRIAIAYLSLLLLPLVVGFSLKKLVMDEHVGWYSWALQSLTAFVYTFGFVLMTPQLYINYKLKSVAHLPWRFLCYRSLNTVIDDLFAFVIRMPTMHRLSCFRDDVVFVIYLYQRWMYPVDTSRPQDRG